MINAKPEEITNSKIVTQTFVVRQVPRRKASIPTTAIMDSAIGIAQNTPRASIPKWFDNQ